MIGASAVAADAEHLGGRAFHINVVGDWKSMSFDFVADGGDRVTERELYGSVPLAPSPCGDIAIAGAP